MNDRFRFRAWDKVCGRMLYNIQEAYDGGCVEDKEGEPVEDYIGVCSFAGFFPYEGQKENGYIVEQCTGLKDKNGKLIYEGDIVVLDDTDSFENPIKTVVRWAEENASFGLFCSHNLYYGFYSYESENFEVIGNIHEHGGLLNEN